tara:strand:- start:1902 stop:2474 length:573 start_codon:yes stop_codon:yes gene_type:complete
MGFDQKKAHQLSKKDMSKKGFIDKEIKPLVDQINNMKNLYTTSSCAGRTLLLEKKSDKKFDIAWIYCDHNQASLKKIKEILKNPPKSPVWIKQEPAIIHICCRDLKVAEKLLVICKHTGFKYSGIISIGKRITIEVLSSENLETIISENNTLLVSQDYLKRIVKECNAKMKRNKQRLERFSLGIKELEQD